MTEPTRSRWNLWIGTALGVTVVATILLVAWQRTRLMDEERAFVGKWVARRVGHDIPFEFEYLEDRSGYLGFDRSPEFSYQWAVHDGHFHLLYGAEVNTGDALWRRILGWKPQGAAMRIVCVTDSRIVVDDGGGNIEFVRADHPDAF